MTILTAKTVECFYKGQRVASHVRSSLAGRHTTVKEHMPVAHRSYAELMRLGKIYGPQRLEAASKRALHYQAISYRSINSILKN